MNSNPRPNRSSPSEGHFDNGTIAGLLFFTLAAQFMTVIMLAAAMVPGYDFRAAAISDLGVVPETALLFNVSLVLVGVFNLLGGYFFYRTHGRRWLLAVFALAGVGAIGRASSRSTPEGFTASQHCLRSCSSTCRPSGVRLASLVLSGFYPSSLAGSVSSSSC
ncbi:DUF998 domain-containing protein [Halomicroarcula sp. GCM10025710]